MKKVLVLIFACIMTFNVFGDYVDITTNPNEDGTVSPNCVNSQAWDLEGFSLDGSMLKMTGGYDFKNGEASGNWTNPVYTSGDIFIDIDGGYGVSNGENPTNSNGNKDVVNTFGYEYAIDLDFENMTYTVYDLTTGDAVTTTAYYKQNFHANPWEYVSGGEAIVGEVDKSFSYVTGLTNAQTGFSGGSHNEVIVDLSFLGDNQDFTAHFTMECGNDDLIGQGTVSVPEPGTLSLLSVAGIYMFGFFYSRKKKNYFNK